MTAFDRIDCLTLVSKAARAQRVAASRRTPLVAAFWLIAIVNRRAISSGLILAMCRLMIKRLRVSRLVTIAPLCCAHDTRVLAAQSIWRL